MGITAICVFTDHCQNYWHICFRNGSERDYRERDLAIRKSCLEDATSKNVFSYLNGELVIMTPDNGEEDVISVIKAVVGDHERDRMNKRQIDSVVQEVLPQLNYPQTEIGVIAPYNNQVNALNEALSGTEINTATVHKFQGREKDTIILTTVDDEVTDFTDTPYLFTG